MFDKDEIFSPPNLPQFDECCLTYPPPIASEMAPRATGRGGVAAKSTRESPVTTRSRSRARPKAAATTTAPGPSSNPGPTPPNPEDNATGPALPNPGNNVSAEANPTEVTPTQTTPGQGTLDHPALPGTLPTPQTTPAEPAVASTTGGHSELLAAICEIANNQATFSQSLARTQDEVSEMRSLIGERSSHGSSRQSIRTLKEESRRGKRPEQERLSGTDTIPGSDPVTELESGPESCFESVSRSGTMPSFCEWTQRTVAGAGSRTNHPATNTPKSLLNEQIEPSSPGNLPVFIPTPSVGGNQFLSVASNARSENVPRTQPDTRMGTKVASGGGPNDPNPSDSKGDHRDDQPRHDTLPHFCKSRMPDKDCDKKPVKREPSPPAKHSKSPQRRWSREPRKRESQRPDGNQPPDRDKKRRGHGSSSSPPPLDSSPEPDRHRTPFDNSRPERQSQLQVGETMRKVTGTEYRWRLLQYYEDMIDAQVTHSIYYPKDYRGLGDPGPEPYDRSADIDEFERWLVQLLKLYQINKMCGRKADFLRVVSIGRYLSGEASEWYCQEYG